MPFDLLKPVSRLLCLLLLSGLAACARMPLPAAYVINGQAAQSEEQVQSCLHQQRRGHTHLSLPPP